MKENEYLWPCIQLIASLLNVSGAMAAIALGADHVNGKLNPFFYTALATSSLYSIGNMSRIIQIYRKPTFVEKEEKRLEIINIQK